MSTKTIKLIIDDRNIEAPKGLSLLEVALNAGIYIPHLCSHPDLSSIGSCQLCIVEIYGKEGFYTACTVTPFDGMVVKTNTEKIIRTRRLAMELMLSGHPPDCSTCNKYLSCELQSIKQYLGVERTSLRTRTRPFSINHKNPLFMLDPGRCIVCGRCVRACRELRGAGVLSYRKKGTETYIGTTNDLPLIEAGCQFCGSCAEVCPTGAIMDKEEIIQGKSRKSALVPCEYTCPAEIDVPRYVRFIQIRDYPDALAVIREKVPFPGVLSYVCDHPCEATCRRGELNQPISIRELKRFVFENDKANLWGKNSIHKCSTSRKVAIIGSGPAGLTAAYFLSKQGHNITVYESLPQPGGMMRFGIPEYRLPRSILDAEIKVIEDLGVEIQTSVNIVSLDSLFEQNFDAILIAIGTQKGQKLPVPGLNNTRIFVGIDFLKSINLKNNPDIGSAVLVIGGGNVALDCGRLARRLGAESVHIACLESKEKMPAASEEISLGEEEGLIIHDSCSLTQILSSAGNITGAEFLKVSSFHVDEEKNIEFTTIEDSRHRIEADTIIFAVGQRPDIPAGFGINTIKNDLLEIDSYSCATNREKVFAAGDAVNGPTSVINAIASGRKSAIAVDQFLGGDGNINEHLAPGTELMGYLEHQESFGLMHRCEDHYNPGKAGAGILFSTIQSKDEETATRESKRCLQCDLRLKIKPVKFWGSY